MGGAHMKTIYFAGGCFWGVEEFFSRIKGVTSTEVGYANSHVENPTYEMVCSGETGAVEAVKVDYDPDLISLKKLLSAFFSVIDPTTLNQQGPDRGTQYRTGIYSIDEQELAQIGSVVQREQNKYEKHIVTEVLRLTNYYPAEEYHQNYLKKNPTGHCHIDLDKLHRMG